MLFPLYFHLCRAMLPALVGKPALLRHRYPLGTKNDDGDLTTHLLLVHFSIFFKAGPNLKSSTLSTIFGVPL